MSCNTIDYYYYYYYYFFALGYLHSRGLKTYAKKRWNGRQLRSLSVKMNYYYYYYYYYTMT